MESCIPCLRADCHRRGREVLHLLQMEVEPLGLHGELRHVLFVAAGVAAYEVWYDLLVQLFLLVYPVEYSLELSELFERWFAHESEHVVGCVFGRHLESSAHMAAY